MKIFSTGTLAVVAACCALTHAQNIPWTFTYGPGGSVSAQGTQHCRQEDVRQGERYGFQMSWAQPAPVSSAPSPPQQSQCSLRTTMSKDWERRNQQCDSEKDRTRKDQCWDRLTKDKKREKDNFDDCLRRRERECGAIGDSGSKERCFRNLDDDRAGRPLQPQQQQKPQTKCCLRLFSDNSCKNRVFETCSAGSGLAQGDASSWNVACA